MWVLEELEVSFRILVVETYYATEQTILNVRFIRKLSDVNSLDVISDTVNYHHFDTLSVLSRQYS